MSATFLDGPAAGQSFELHRAPMYVRAVRESLSLSWDVLNEPDDEPNAGEEVHVYECVPETWTFVFVRPGGRYESCEYRHRPDVDGELLRETAAWREWATSQPAIAMETPGTREAMDAARAVRDRVFRDG